QLPPEIVMNAGALQPFAVRQVATPLPPSAPKIKPPLTTCGITATHFACCNTSSGILLSGIPIISCITLVALSSRSMASSRADPAQHNVPRPNIASTNIIFFMEHPYFCYLCLIRLYPPTTPTPKSWWMAKRIDRGLNVCLRRLGLGDCCLRLE